MLFIHGNILTMEETSFPDGYLWVKDGKIAGVGPSSEAPADPETVDLMGKTVLPGFVDAHCHLGMWEDGLGFEGDDGNEATDPVTPQLRAIDALNPLDRTFAEARLGGVTTVLTGPGSANAIGGQWAAIKTAGRRIDDMVIDPAVGMKFALGENPKVTYNEKNVTPVTRMATASLIREQLRKAERYLSDKERADEDEDFDEPEFDAKCEALVPVLSGKQKAFFHAHRADDIFTAIRIAREFKLDLVLVHCTEGHLIAEDLAEEKAQVITGPLMTTRSKPELRNATDKNPGILNQHGVKTAICTDYNVMPIGLLPICAGMAVREGMDPMQALAAITIYPAEIVGISDRVGSLKTGKDADFAVFAPDCDPLTIAAKPELVVVNGKIVRR